GGGKFAALFEDALGGFERGDVGVAEDREAVGAEREHVVDGAVERGGGLQGKAVDEVDVDGGETGLAQFGDGAAVDFHGLHAVDGGLHGGIGVLHADGGATGAEHAEGEDLRRVEVTGVDLDADLRVGGETEVPVDEFGETMQLLGGEKGGGSAAEVELDDAATAVDARGDEGDFLGEVVDVVGGGFAMGRDDVGATAEPAARGAEREVKVETEGRGMGAGCGRGVVVGD